MIEASAKHAAGKEFSCFQPVGHQLMCYMCTYDGDVIHAEQTSIISAEAS